MNFCTVDFILFCIILAVLYYIVIPARRWMVLLAGSLIFLPSQDGNIYYTPLC